MNLVLVARRYEKLELLSRELIQAHGIKVKIVSVDVSNPDFLKKIQSVTDSLEIGLLVNNAGFALTGEFLDHTLEEELSLLNVNCGAPLILAHTFGKKMAQRGNGGIINVASASAFLPMPFWTNYAASKAYLLYFSEGLGYELREKGVDVLVLCPGATRTEFSKVAGTKSGGMEPVQVIHIALKKLGKQPIAIAGVKNKIISFINRFLPRQLLTKIGAKVVHDFMVYK